jgi:hypothetical protein
MSIRRYKIVEVKGLDSGYLTAVVRFDDCRDRCGAVSYEDEVILGREGITLPGATKGWKALGECPCCGGVT